MLSPLVRRLWLLPQLALPPALPPALPGCFFHGCLHLLITHLLLLVQFQL
jgi:hypothetical protein